MRIRRRFSIGFTGVEKKKKSLYKGRKRTVPMIDGRDNSDRSMFYEVLVSINTDG